MREESDSGLAHWGGRERIKNVGRVGKSGVEDMLKISTAFIVHPSALHPPAPHTERGGGEPARAPEGQGPTCDGEQNEQPERLHAGLLWRRADTGCLVQGLVFPLNCRKERVQARQVLPTGTGLLGIEK